MYIVLDRLYSQLMPLRAQVREYVCARTGSHQSRYIRQSLAPSIFNRSSPNLERRLPGKWRSNCTINSQNGLIICACAAIYIYSNEMFSFINAGGRNFSPIFTKFGTLVAEVIFNAEFICDRKRKYFARMRGSRISVFFAPYTVFYV